jgi:hypothetical protein
MINFANPQRYGIQRAKRREMGKNVAIHLITELSTICRKNKITADRAEKPLSGFRIQP